MLFQQNFTINMNKWHQAKSWSVLENILVKMKNFDGSSGQLILTRLVMKRKAIICLILNANIDDRKEKALSLLFTWMNLMMAPRNQFKFSTLTTAQFSLKLKSFCLKQIISERIEQQLTTARYEASQDASSFFSTQLTLQARNDRYHAM